MSKISKFQLLRALSAAENARFESPNIPRRDLFQASKRSANQRALEKLLRPTLTKVGFDLKSFDKILKQHETERDRIMKKDQARAIKRSSRTKRILRSTMTRQRNALKKLTADLQPQASRYLISLERPFLIWATPQANIITDSRIEPWNSWAKFRFTSSSSGTNKLSFYFLWNNPTDYYAVMNASSFLAVNGHCYVGRDGGIFPDYRYSGVTLMAHLCPWEWWNTPRTLPAGQSNQQQELLNLSVSGGGSFDVGALDARDVYNAANLQYTLFLVPPHGVVVFEVVLAVSYSNTHGTVDVDFSSGDFEIMCPVVILSLLTAPPATVGTIATGALLEFTT